MMAQASELQNSSARWLLADLLLWHQREARPDWWIYFERILTYDTQKFLEDADCIGGLQLVGQVGEIKQSFVWRFSFPTDQDFKIKVGDEVFDPMPARTELFVEEAEGMRNFPSPKKVGEVVAIDEVNGFIDVKRGKKQGSPTASNFMPGTRPPDEKIRKALQRLAQALINDEGSLDSQFSAAWSLLRLRKSKFRAGASLAPIVNESASNRFIRLAPLLDKSYLVVQGPPGSGKTWALARAVIECVIAGQKVGLCAFKHETLKSMVDAIVEALNDPKISARLKSSSTNLKIMRKIETGEKPADETNTVTEVDGYEEIFYAVESNSHNVFAGTAWVFTDEQAPKLDVIFIDEAGQMSLANAVGVSTAAKSLVLVGDPQQLAQPGKGSHPLMPEEATELYPYGATASALQHVLKNNETVPDDEGIFLDVTQRLHPEICQFISEAMYNGRLENAPHCNKRSIIMATGAHESGIRWCPVEHEGNKMYSTEEVDAIKNIVTQFVGSSLINKDGEVRALSEADIMIVAPYNSQVNDLKVALPDCKVGTVDKFQGLESPVVILSLTASSSEDVPRGVDFLYSTNRFNVAVSRAKTLCIVVGSPRLLAARCNSVRQLQLVNVLCRYVQMAKRWV
jgi:uncharacterized protein